jgi:hypothetical protein
MRNATRLANPPQTTLSWNLNNQGRRQSSA